MKIGHKRIGGKNRCFLIAEIAQAHDGSLAMAYNYVDAAAEAGADAIKFQTHIAEAESTREERFRTKRSPQDASRYDYWKRMEFSPQQWSGLSRHAKKKGLIFLSSPFSDAAVCLLKKMKIPAWKIGSGETASKILLDYVLKHTKGPILLSSGMSKWNEIDKVVKAIRRSKRKFALFHCVSEYPTPLRRAGLNLLREYQTRYGVPIGLSDHSGSIYPSLGAIALGASLIETHLVLHRNMYGPDATSSLTKEEFRIVREFADAWFIMQKNQVNKNTLAADARQMRIQFGRSLALRKACPRGTKITEDLLTYKKPGTGIPVECQRNIIGKVLTKSKKPDQLLCWGDLK